MRTVAHTLSEAGILWTKRSPMKGSFCRARQHTYARHEYSADCSYLKDVLLYAWDARHKVNDGKQADSAVAG